MWVLEQDRHNNKNNSRANSKSSSTSSSSTLPSTPRRSMEDVWKDINMASPPLPLYNQYHRHHQPHKVATSTSSHLRGVILQDFLSDAYKEPLLPSHTLPHHCPHPHTTLSLNSARDFRHASSKSNSIAHQHNGTHSNGDEAFIFDGIAPPDGLFPSFFPKKRALEPQLDEGLGIGGDGDRRQKRMIKNRESAARSRARKQAYTHELELEVRHLAEENEKLKKEHRKLRKAMAEQIVTKKKLQRCNTAPF